MPLVRFRAPLNNYRGSALGGINQPAAKSEMFENILQLNFISTETLNHLLEDESQRVGNMQNLNALGNER
jgi:tRNA 2-selenouridine synthase SelU